MNEKKCFKDLYAPYKWTLFAAVLVQLLFGGFMTLGIYADWMYIVLPILTVALLVAARFCHDRRAARVAVRAVTALPVAFGVLMLLFQTAASAASGWQLSFATILWDAVRSTLPMLLWLAPVYGVAARSRSRYDRVALCVAQGFTAALAVATVVLAHLPRSGILTANDWGVPHIAALYALAGVCVAVFVITLVYAAARPDRRAVDVDVDDGTDTFDGMYHEMQQGK